MTITAAHKNYTTDKISIGITALVWDTTAWLLLLRNAVISEWHDIKCVDKTTEL